MTDKTIYKYEADGDGTYQLPDTAEIVLVAHQDHVFPTVWAIVGPHDHTQGTILQAVGTGHRLPPSPDHVGSAVCGAFVWHLVMV